MKDEKEIPEKGIGLFKEPLGMSIKQYRELLASLPQFKDLPRKRREIILKKIGIKPEIDKDVEMKCSSVFGRLDRKKREINGTPTRYGQLEKDVNGELGELPKKGFTWKGRGEKKEKAILHELHDIAWYQYPKIAQGILDKFTEEEREEIRLGTIHILKCDKEDVHPFLYDKRIFDFYDFRKWRRSYKDQIYCSVKILKEAFDTIFWKHEEIDMKIERYEKEKRGKENRAQQERRMKWIDVLSYIYAVKSVEKIMEVKFLKSDTELLKIWKIPRKTFYRRLQYLRDTDAFNQG